MTFDFLTYKCPFVTNVSIALIPVVAFLVMLWLMDSFRLVRPGSILAALMYGIVAAAAVLWLHEWLLHVRQVPAGALSRGRGRARRGRG